MEVLMRTLIVFSLLAFFSLMSRSTGGQGRPIPPGIREADKQTNKPLDPPLINRTPSLNPAKLKHEADELAQLSAGLPSDLAHVAHGQLPKDLSEKLKRIEKLAKHLRGELSQ
jgi:hypothetical protein